MEKETALALGIGALAVLILRNRQRTAVGAVFPEMPAFYECNDGHLTTSSSAKACTWHGGLKSRTPVQFTAGEYSGLLNISDVPLNKIQIDTRLFQGREKAFSARSVDNIINDVLSGRFLWENLDPITLWKSPSGGLFLLSGHSRLEAFKRLSADRQTNGNKTFDRIPAKILSNVPADVAKTVALESNTLSTKESDIERAAYYRRLRQDGQPEKSILEAVKRTEGRNWTNVYAYTFLNPDGRTWAMVRQFGDGEDTSATLAKSLTKWVGQARRNFPALTGAHENELFAWLFEQKGYGTGNNQVSSEREFLDKVAEFVAKNTFFGTFDAEKPLNIQNLLHKSPTEMQYDRQIDEARKAVQSAETELKTETRLLVSRGATTADVQRITQPIETRLRLARIELQKLLQKRNEVIEYSKNEARLFGLPRRRVTISYI